jgi:hypothetical protein
VALSDDPGAVQNKMERRVPHPSFFEGWDSAPTACDLLDEPGLVQVNEGWGKISCRARAA